MCDLSMAHDRTVLLLQGHLTVMAGALSGDRMNLSPGMGLVLKCGERFEVIECPDGAVLLMIEAQWLDATGLGTSTPVLGDRSNG